MKTAILLFKSMRPNQWIKNGFIVLPLIFSKNIFHFPNLLKNLAAVAIFCILSSAIYLINDIMDLKDKFEKEYEKTY